jgi:hypothetical protein
MPFSDDAGRHQGFISRTSTSLAALAFTRSRLNCTLATFRRDGSHGRSRGACETLKVSGQLSRAGASVASRAVHHSGARPVEVRCSPKADARAASLAPPGPQPARHDRPSVWCCPASHEPRRSDRAGPMLADDPPRLTANRRWRHASSLHAMLTRTCQFDLSPDQQAKPPWKLTSIHP